MELQRLVSSILETVVEAKLTLAEGGAEDAADPASGTYEDSLALAVINCILYKYNEVELETKVTRRSVITKKGLYFLLWVNVCLALCFNSSVLNVKALVGAFNQSRGLLRDCATSPINRFAALVVSSVIFSQ